MSRTGVGLSALLALLLCSSTSSADRPGRAVRVFFNDGGRREHWSTGDEIPKERVITLLFLKEKCPLDIADKQYMLRAWMAYGAYQLGCWYGTTDGRYGFVGQFPAASAAGTYWRTLPRGLLTPTGTIKITEPDYDSRTFADKVMRQMTQEMLEQSQQAP